MDRTYGNLSVSGNIFKGQKLPGKMTGLGRLTFYKQRTINPGKYEGYVKNGKFHGNGTLALTNGLTYSGTYKNHEKWTGIETKESCNKKYKDGVEQEC